MSILIILVLIFAYFYCSTLEAAMETTGDFNGNYYDSNHRRDYRLWRYSSRVWDLSKFE